MLVLQGYEKRGSQEEDVRKILWLRRKRDMTNSKGCRIEAPATARSTSEMNIIYCPSYRPVLVRVMRSQWFAALVNGNLENDMSPRRWSPHTSWEAWLKTPFPKGLFQCKWCDNFLNQQSHHFLHLSSPIRRIHYYAGFARWNCKSPFPRSSHSWHYCSRLGIRFTQIFSTATLMSHLIG